MVIYVLNIDTSVLKGIIGKPTYNMKKDEKRAVIIIFIVALILIVALDYSNYTTAKKKQLEREKIEARLEVVKAKDSIEIKKD